MRVHPAVGGRTPAANTRRRILAVALEQFSAHGYAGTSMRDIAGAMGMTKAALYYHFESKEQILAAVTEPIRVEMNLLQQAMSAPAPPTPAELLTQLADMLSRHALLVETVFHDPSSGGGGQHMRAKEVFGAITALLAGNGGPDSLLRARCALGAVMFTVRANLRTDPRFGEPLRSDRALRLLGGEEHALDAGQRRKVVAAALRALDEQASGSASA